MKEFGEIVNVALERRDALRFGLRVHSLDQIIDGSLVAFGQLVKVVEGRRPFIHERLSDQLVHGHKPLESVLVSSAIKVMGVGAIVRPSRIMTRGGGYSATRPLAVWLKSL